MVTVPIGNGTLSETYPAIDQIFPTPPFLALAFYLLPCGDLSFESQPRGLRDSCTYHTFIPDEIRPRMVCFPSSHGVGPKVTKNWGVRERSDWARNRKAEIGETFREIKTKRQNEQKRWRVRSADCVTYFVYFFIGTAREGFKA